MIIKKKTLRRGKEEILPQQNFVEEDNDGAEEIFGTDLTEDEESDVEAVENVEALPQKTEPEDIENPDDIDLFSLDNIDFSQRQERRRGDRRRGFRRVDDRNLISRAREEADTIREAASKEGYQAGIEQAKADIALLKDTLTAFMNAPQEVYEQIAPDILEISVDIAKKIIKKEVSEEPQVLMNTIVEVMKGLSKEETKVILRVNPTQVDITKQSVPEMLNLAGLDTKVVVLSDENVSEGGCMVTTGNGVVDATIETQLSVISEALREI
ncbi:MAG: hypothetical protein KH301_07190 [Brachyspira sp.]|uniref:FliH/SctL family protein n=1 Tax=Candidatus Scatousia sp. TaxID=3085663 RepID=UPI004028B68D|nr:hypothetical protein [Brachyspira sp.]